MIRLCFKAIIPNSELDSSGRECFLFSLSANYRLEYKPSQMIRGKKLRALKLFKYVHLCTSLISIDY